MKAFYHCHCCCCRRCCCCRCCERPSLLAGVAACAAGCPRCPRGDDGTATTERMDDDDGDEGGSKMASKLTDRLRATYQYIHVEGWRYVETNRYIFIYTYTDVYIHVWTYPYKTALPLPLLLPPLLLLPLLRAAFFFLSLALQRVQDVLDALAATTARRRRSGWATTMAMTIKYTRIDAVRVASGPKARHAYTWRAMYAYI